WDSIVGSWDSQTAVWSTQSRRRLIYGDPNATKIYSLDTGYPFGSGTVTSFLERTGLAIVGKDRHGQPKVDYEQRKICTRIWPKIRGAAPVTVRVGVQDSLDLDAAVTWMSPQTFVPSTGYLDVYPPLNGRAFAVRFESTADLSWQLESYG